MNATMKTLTGALACALAFGVAAAVEVPTGHAQGAAGVKGTWTARPSGTHLQLELRRARERGTSSHSFPIPLAELPGLAPGQLAGKADVRFELKRDAGTLVLEGRFQDGEGAGHFTFSGNPEFVRAMSGLGYSGLDEEKLFTLAAHDVSRAVIQDLAGLGYEKLSLDQLVSMRIHGATPEFVRELKALGYDRLPVDQLVSMRIHGATPEFVRELKALGYDRLPVDQLVSMRIHGVFPEFVRELKELGYTAVPVDDLVSMRIHGVTPEFVRLVNRKDGQVPVSSLVSMKIHGRTR
jgi:hypothetical protein